MVLKDKHRRRFHHYVCQTGPSYIRKDTVPFDSCDVYTTRIGWEYDQTRKTWEEGMAHLDNSAIFREDPFGIKDYAVNFSLNKKRRWEMGEEIGERIEEVQDPSRKLRVSASVHTQDVSKDGYFYSGTPRDLGCTEYHSVTRDGAVTHRQSENRKTRMRNFSHPEPRTARSPAGPRPNRYKEKNNWHEDSDLGQEEGEKFQKAHVHYTTVRLTSLPSLHNKVSHSWNDCYWPCGKNAKFARKIDTEVEVEECSCCWQDNDTDEENDILEDVIVDEEDAAEFEVIDQTDVIVEEFEHVNRSSLPIMVNDLSALVVRNRKNRK